MDMSKAWLVIPLIMLLAGIAIFGVFLYKKWLGQRGAAAPQASEAQKESKPLISLVLFLREARPLDEETLRRIASEALGVTFSENEKATEFVVGSPPLFLVSVRGAMFSVNVIARPYFDKSEDSLNEIIELRTREAVRQHRAWVSVDLMRLGPPCDSAKAYSVIGPLIGALADDNCLGVFCPETRQFAQYDPSMKQVLQGPNPLILFADPPKEPIIHVADVAAVAAASAEARRRWPEFVEAFASRNDGPPFLVKASFGNSEHTEYMWVEVTAIENDIIYGIMTNDPLYPGNPAKGSRVSVPAASLADWLYGNKEREPIGGFTLDIVRRSVEGPQRENPPDELTPRPDTKGP